MELQSFDELEHKVSKFLEQLRITKSERDELAKRVSKLEAEVAQLKQTNKATTKELDEARHNARDPEKEERIRSKVDEMLAKLEGF
jgi:predicted  nucleic acid-binding Zn-ribbon protein